MNRILASGLVFVLVAAWVIYFKDDVAHFYYALNQSMEKWTHLDLQEALPEIKEEISTPPPLTVNAPPKQVTLTVAGIISETNRHRQENGDLVVLRENLELRAAAEAKAKDMFDNQYFEHDSPSGVSPAELVKEHGYEYAATGENLILGNFDSEKDLVQAWMDSPGHRENILNGRYTEIGIAIMKGFFRGQTVWIGVQEFGRPQPSCARPQRALRLEIEENKALIEQMSAEMAQRKQELDQMNSQSAEYQQKVNEYNQLVEQYNQKVQETKDLISTFNAQVTAYNACMEAE